MGPASVCDVTKQIGKSKPRPRSTTFCPIAFANVDEEATTSTWLRTIPVLNTVPGSSWFWVRWVFGRCTSITFLRLQQHFPFNHTGDEKARILSTCRGSTLHKAALRLITSKLPPATLQNNTSASVGEREKTAIWGLDPNLKAGFSKGNCPHSDTCFCVLVAFPARHTGESKTAPHHAWWTWLISVILFSLIHLQWGGALRLHPFDTGFSAALSVFQEVLSQTGLCYCISKAWDKLLTVSKVTECLGRLCMIKLRLYYLFGMIKMLHLHKGMCSGEMIFTKCSNTMI